MDGITEKIRQDILCGHLEPGDRLLEISLSENYSCGRAAVRSALVTLVSEGLVERQANRGATVRRVSLNEAIHITEARAALECLMVRQAADNVTNDDRDDLNRIVVEMSEAVSSNDNAGYSLLNRELHRRIRQMSQNQIAAELVDNLRNRAAHQQYRLAAMPGRLEVSLEQHVAIVEAISRADADAADTAMRTHLDSVISVLRSWGDAV